MTIPKKRVYEKTPEGKVRLLKKAATVSVKCPHCQQTAVRRKGAEGEVLFVCPRGHVAK